MVFFLKNQSRPIICSLITPDYFSKRTTSHDPGIILHPVILRGAEGEVAESIIQHNPRPSGEGGLRRRWVRVRQEHLTNTLFLL